MVARTLRMWKIVVDALQLHSHVILPDGCTLIAVFKTPVSFTAIA